MPTRLPKSGTDINVWGLTLNDCLRVIGQENIIVEKDGDNPPTIKAGSKFLVYKEFSYLIPDTTATGNNVYPADTSIDTPISEAIFLSADVSFNWSSGGVPAKANSTQYYIVCTGAEDTDETSIGKGIFDVQTSTETGAVAYDKLKSGWYTANDDRAIVKFATDSSGTVERITPIDTDYWHYIGDVGEPAWTSGSYDNADFAVYGYTGFRKIGGMVHFYGYLYVTVAGTIFTLPVGYRPLKPQTRWILNALAGFQELITINTDGTVVAGYGGGTPVYFDFAFPIDKY